MMATRKGRNM